MSGLGYKRMRALLFLGCNSLLNASNFDCPDADR